MLLKFFLDQTSKSLSLFDQKSSSGKSVEKRKAVNFPKRSFDQLLCLIWVSLDKLERIVEVDMTPAKLRGDDLIQSLRAVDGQGFGALGKIVTR